MSLGVSYPSGGNRILNGGGEVAVNSDGSIAVTPASGKNLTLASGQLVVPDGGSATPSITFQSENTLGIFRGGAQNLRVQGGVLSAAGGIDILGGKLQGRTSAFHFYMPSGATMGWSNSSGDATSADTMLARDAANILAQRNGTNPQALRTYNTYTDSLNYERAKIAWESNQLVIGAESAGTGVARGVLVSNGVGSLGINSDGSLTITPASGKNLTLASGQLVVPNGSISTPGLALSGSPVRGIWSDNTSHLGIVSNGTKLALYQSPTRIVAYSQLTVENNQTLAFASSGDGLNSDVFLRRDDANALAQRNGGFAQTSRIYNTFTDSLNYERAKIAWETNELVIGPESTGTGVTRGMRISAGGGSIAINSNGSLTITPASGQHLTLASGVLQLPGGTASAPSLAGGTSGNPAVSGLAPYVSGAGAPALIQNGIAVLTANAGVSDGLRLKSNLALSWSSNDPTQNASDLFLFREAANILAQRNGTSIQTFRIYKTYTDASNYARLSFSSDGTHLKILQEEAGTGASGDLVIGTTGGRGLYFQTNNVSRWGVAWNGHFNATADNTYDIGMSSSGRPRNIFVGSSLVSKVKAGIPTDSDVVNPADGMMMLDSTNNRVYFRIGGVWKYAALT